MKRVLENRFIFRDLDLSIIIPVRNEEENVMGLAREIETVMQTMPWSWECLWVDDGSTDNTLSQLRQINERYDHHQFLSLSSDCGQSASLWTGFNNARGNILVTLDGDGQNDPNDLPVLVRHLLEDDVDMVNGWRRERKDTAVRKIASSIANTFRNWVTREQVRDVGCSIRVFHRRCVDNIPVFNGMHRFLPTLVRMNGWQKIVEMPVHHRPRKHGRTKYGIFDRLGVGLMDTLAVRWMQTRMMYPEVKIASFTEMKAYKRAGCSVMLTPHQEEPCKHP